MSILGLIIAFVLIFIVCKIFSVSVKIMMKLLINGLIGAAMLYVINIVGTAFDFNIQITWITALISGVFGIPGVVMLGVLTLIG